MAKKRKQYGLGHFTVINSSTCSLDFYYEDIDGKKRKKQVRGIDRNECNEKRDAFLQDIDAIKGGKNFNVTIPSICKAIQVLKLNKNLISKSAYSRNLSTISIIEKSDIGSIPIREISETQLSLFMDSLVWRYSQSVIDKIYQQLLIAYSDAKNNKVLRENPFDNKNNIRLEKPKSKKDINKVSALSLEKQTKLKEVLNNSKLKYKNVLLISLYSGMRIGEILCLNVSDIDLEKRVIHVNKTISRGIDYKAEIKDTTKTKNGIRDVHVFDQLVPVLQDCIKNANKGGALFRSENGELVTTAQVTDEYRSIAKKYATAYSGGHSLRHTFITNCCNAGVPLQALAKWVGHSDIAFMLKTYYDLLEDQEEIEIEKAQNYINNI